MGEFFKNLFTNIFQAKKEEEPLSFLEDAIETEINLHPLTEKEKILAKTTEESNLKEQLRNDPLNIALKQKLEDLLLSNYNWFMQNEKYLDATHRAESMLELEEENTKKFLEKKELLKNSLCADIAQLKEEKNTLLLNQREEKLKKLNLL